MHFGLQDIGAVLFVVVVGWAFWSATRKIRAARVGYIKEDPQS